MKALLVIDAQNEFSAAGRRPVPSHSEILVRIHRRVKQARDLRRPIAWVQHFNKPDESPAFLPDSWGSALSPGLGPKTHAHLEKLFQKDVFGAFSGTDLEDWLRSLHMEEVLLVGFFTHMCLSTSAREALVRGFSVEIDPAATGAHQIVHPVLGMQTADEVRRTALLQLSDMGVKLVESEQSERTEPVTVSASRD